MKAILGKPIPLKVEKNTLVIRNSDKGMNAGCNTPQQPGMVMVLRVLDETFPAH